MSKHQPIGVGIIGLSAKGGWAATAHVEALRAMPDHFALKALSASTPDSSKAAGEVFNIDFATDDPAALVAHPEVELVVVTVKVPHHRELVAHALSAGKSVYCEWPLGRNLEDATAIAAAARERKITAFVGLQGRSAPAVRYLRDLVAQDYVGKVVSSNVIGSGGFPWGGAVMAGMEYVLDDSTGATMLSIPFGHMIDAFTWILGDFTRLTATLATQYPAVHRVDGDGIVSATAPDQVVVGGVLNGGGVVSLQYRGGDAGDVNFRWEVCGTDGVLIIEGDSGHLQYGHIRLRGRKGAEQLVDLPVPGEYRRVATDAAGYSDAVAHAYRAVYDDLREGTSTVPTFADAVKTHELLTRIERAADWPVKGTHDDT